MNLEPQTKLTLPNKVLKWNCINRSIIKQKDIYKYICWKQFYKILQQEKIHQ